MLRIIETFRSIQGEGTHAGLPCGFVRLARCNLRCVWCDTEYSFKGGQPRSQESLLDEIEAWNVRHVCVTGGEPMLQAEAAIDLMNACLERGWVVLLETHGALPLADVPEQVVKVMDVKTPGALGASADDPKFLEQHFCYANLDVLTAHDEVKIVVNSRQDYEWARDFVREHRLEDRCGAVLFSPSWDDVAPADLSAWILEDGLRARLNLQLHKYVWDPAATGV